MTETERLLRAIPGGQKLHDWFEGRVDFGDGEVAQLLLQRSEPSRLVIEVDRMRHGAATEFALITFHLKDVAEVKIEGFSHQNVIGGLLLRDAHGRDLHPSLVGIGIEAPAHKIELEPCAGAFGTIEATIVEITFAVSHQSLGAARTA